MFRIPSFAVPLVFVAAFIARGFVTLVLVYIGARLAIRHERRAAS
jgi:phage shock protein PspC (stress-responsive transcriptional regulator)